MASNTKKEFPEDFEEQIKYLNDIQLSLVSKLKKIEETMGTDGDGKEDPEALILSLRDLNSISNTISNLTKNVQSSLFKKRELEYKEKIDFHHPKIVKSYSFLAGAFVESMMEADIPTEQVNRTVDIMSYKLVGFEDKMNSTLKNLNMNLVDSSKNPLIGKMLNSKN